MRSHQRIPYLIRIKRAILAEAALLLLTLAVWCISGETSFTGGGARALTGTGDGASSGKPTQILVGEYEDGRHVLTLEEDYIKWVDFTISYEALCKAYEWDLKTHGTECEIGWIDLLAYTAARTGGKFDAEALKIMEKAACAMETGEKSLKELTGKLDYFAYYREAYDAVLGGLVGEYERECEGNPGSYETVYGLKGYFPLAAGFEYSHSDDFGVGRSYGYKRKHLGHDMMGRIGTPIIAVESGTVEALGWNQYGGWRIGIRSFDKKRYYYYAHLRQNYPYAEGLEEGSVVTAGDVIGYMGHTGYSTEENVNNIEVVHLHWGLQLIFDESQKEGNNEIWVDIYPLTRFLAKHKQTAVKVDGTKEWVRTDTIIDPWVEQYGLSQDETADSSPDAP